MNDLTVTHPLAANTGKAGFPITAAQTDTQHAGLLGQSFADILGGQENQMQDEAEVDFAVDSSLSNTSEDALPDAAVDTMVELESTESAADQPQIRNQFAMAGSIVVPSSTLMSEQNALNKVDGHAPNTSSSFDLESQDQAGNPSIRELTTDGQSFDDANIGHTPREGVRTESVTPRSNDMTEVTSHTGFLDTETVPASPRMVELASPSVADTTIVPKASSVLAANPIFSDADPDLLPMSSAQVANQTRDPGGHTGRGPANPTAQPILSSQTTLRPNGFQSGSSAAIAGWPSAQAVTQTVEPQLFMQTPDGQPVTGPPIGSQTNAINSVSPAIIFGRTSEQPVTTAASIAPGLVQAEVGKETLAKPATPDQKFSLAFGTEGHGNNPSRRSETTRSSQIAAAGSVTASRRMATIESASDRISTDSTPVADIRFTSETQLTRAAPDFSSGRPELPRHIAAQLAEVAQRGGPNRPIEITLNPVELGKVRMTFQPSETGIQVHITTERPETLDLMRRHADVLASEFFGIGFDASEFAFSQGQSGDQGRELSDELHESTDSDTLGLGRPESEQSRPIPIIMDRVDIRV